MIELFAKEPSKEFFSFLYQMLVPVTLSRIEKVEKVESPGYSSYSTFSIGGGGRADGPKAACASGSHLGRSKTGALRAPIKKQWVNSGRGEIWVN